MRPDPFLPEERASWLRRLSAFVIDVVVFTLALFAGVALLALANDGNLHLTLQGWRMVVVIGTASLLWDVLWIASPARGKPGHRFVDIRIVRPDGSRVTVVRVAVRWLVRATNWKFLGLEAVASAVSIVKTPRRQAIHDLVADTVAVRADALERIKGPLAYVPSARTDPDTPMSPTADAPASRGPFL